MPKLRVHQLWKLLKITVIRTFFYTPPDFELIFICETTLMFVSTCVIEIAEFSNCWDGAIRVALTHLVFIFFERKEVSILDVRESFNYVNNKKKRAVTFEIFRNASIVVIISGDNNILQPYYFGTAWPTSLKSTIIKI